MAASQGPTKAVQQAILDHFVGNATWTPGSPLYIGLLTAIGTGDTGTVTECSGTNYARVSTTASDWAAAVAGADGTASSMANSVAVTFPAAGGSWGTATSFGIFTASTAGTCLWTGALTASQAIGSGNTPSFAIGDLILQVGNTADTY